MEFAPVLGPALPELGPLLPEFGQEKHNDVFFGSAEEARVV
jgi:hypothetical protein